jgi:hypothetical protein
MRRGLGETKPILRLRIADIQWRIRDRPVASDTRRPIVQNKANPESQSCQTNPISEGAPSVKRQVLRQASRAGNPLGLLLQTSTFRRNADHPEAIVQLPAGGAGRTIAKVPALMLLPIDPFDEHRVRDMNRVVRETTSERSGQTKAGFHRADGREPRWTKGRRTRGRGAA